VEVVDLSNPNSRCNLPDLPSNFIFTTGAFINGKPSVCGTAHSAQAEECWAYNVGINQWDAMPEMTVGRDWHMSSVLPDGTWVVTGGDGSHATRNFEIYNGVSWSQPAVALPLAHHYAHCQVSHGNHLIHFVTSMPR